MLIATLAPSPRIARTGRKGLPLQVWGSQERRSADKRRIGKLLDRKTCSHDALAVNATINNRGQMVLPVKARKAARISQGDIVEVRPEGDGRIVLVRLERPQEPEPIKVKFTRRKGRHTVGSTGRPITSEEVRNLLNEQVLLFSDYRLPPLS